MNDEDSHKIPAAGIGDTDLVALAATNPSAAKEIALLEDLMNQGEETKGDFLRLCQLLFDVGSVAASELLLRRNLDYYEGHELYIQLFGTAKQDEFATAIDSFKFQFDLGLELVTEHDFLVSTFRCLGCRPRTDDFSLLSRPCEIKFGYIEKDRIEADVTLFAPGRDIFGPGEHLLLFFINGVWELETAPA